MSFFGFLSVILGPVMRLIYGLVENYGLTLILFTLLIRLVSFPLALQNQKTMAKQSVFMPMVQEIQTKYRNDQVKQQEELQRLQQEYGYNPTAGCLPQALNFFILFGVIEVIYYPLRYVLQIGKDVLQVAATEIGDASYIYTSEPKIINAVQGGQLLQAFTPEQNAAVAEFNMNFMGINLCEKPEMAFSVLLIFPILAVLTMVLSNVVMMSASGQQMQGSMKYMPWMMSIMFAFICFTLPVAFSLYYAVSNVLMLLQTIVCKKIYDPEKFKKQYAEELAAKKKEKKKRTTVTVVDKKTGESVTKEVSANERDKIRLERARQLDAAKYADERTTPLAKKDSEG